MAALSYIYAILFALGFIAPPPAIQELPPLEVLASMAAPVIPEKEYLGEYYTTGYYSPLGDQDRYFQGRTYAEDVCMNCGCGGDCFTTASGYQLSAIDELSIVACPRGFDM